MNGGETRKKELTPNKGNLLKVRERERKKEKYNSMDVLFLKN